ncbi:MAG TPA: hypothetical protein VL403_06715 [Candidatus Kryptonia bacterium]|nr:hypothetical protein [Candidatus Kryptonia bacterium]
MVSRERRQSPAAAGGDSEDGIASAVVEPTRAARFRSRSGLRGIIAGALAVCAYACGGSGDSAPPRPVAVLSAFPAEMAPVLQQATINDTVMIGDRAIRIGVLGGVPVVIGLTGIGLVNAATTTRAVIEQFNVGGVVVSAVAGSTLQIGDVVVPATWKLLDGSTYAVNPRWLDLANDIASAGAVALDRCTVTAASAQSVCMLQQPVVVVGGVGQSSDPFGNTPVGCIPNGDDLYGCDVPSSAVGSASVADTSGAAPVTAADATPIVSDMETAAIAREATAHGLPFIAFRALSDGGGDPLGLPGFPAQFGEYYRFAARNAAAATVAFLQRVR